MSLLTRQLMTAVLPVALLTATGHVSAQQATSSGAASEAANVGAVDALAEIVVTARRRNENLETVPVAVSALSRDQLQSQDIQSETDLQHAVPGLVVRAGAGPNSLTYSLRGQTVDLFTNSPPGVLIYFDEVPVNLHTATTFYDLDNIQVVKGPQGTLFGRNATGGAILYQTGAVNDQIGGYARASYASYDQTNVQGALNLPLSSAAELRLAGSYSNGGAYDYNLYSGGWLGAHDERSGRLTLKLKPTDDVTNTTTAQYSSEGGTDAPNILANAYPCGSSNGSYVLASGASCYYEPSTPGWAAFLAAHPKAYPYGLVNAAAYQATLGAWRSDIDMNQPITGYATIVVNNTTFAIAPDLTMKNILGYVRSHAIIPADYDGSSYPIFQYPLTPNGDVTGQYYDTEQYSDELQLQGKAIEQRLTYTTGLFATYERDNEIGRNLAFALPPTNPGSVAEYHQLATDRSLAAYAQGTYAILTGLNFTAGLRYTEDLLTSEQAPGSLYYGAASQHMTNNDPSWNVSIDYQLDPQWLIYIAQRGSWRAGGYNFSVDPINKPASGGGNIFAPEKAKDVEVGSKFSGRLGAIPATLNIAVYNEWVDDIQRAAYFYENGVPSLASANIPQAESSGVESDGLIRPLSWLTFGASGAYTDARFTKNQALLFGSLLHYGPYADAPRWSGTIYGEVTRALPQNAGGLSFRAEIYSQSDQYFSNLNSTLNPGSELRGYSLINLRLAWSDIMQSKLTASLILNNAADREYYIGGVPTGGDLGLNTVVAGTPRIVRGEIEYRF